MARPQTTRISLFERIVGMPGDPRVWNDFVATYGPIVAGWCRRHGLQDTDAQDVTQEVLLRFWRRAADFRYDPARRFRSYLWRVVISALGDWSDARKADRLAVGSDSLQRLLGDLPARDELAASIERRFDMERLSLAMLEVEARVKPRTWRAFRMLALEQIPGAEVARALGITTAHAYVARMNVQRMISDTVRRLDTPAPCG